MEKFKCEWCGKEYTDQDEYYSRRFCTKDCRWKAHGAKHSAKMKELHQQGTYVGTSYLTTYNQDWKHKFESGATARSDHKRALATNCKYPELSNRYFYIYKYDNYFKIGVLLLDKDGAYVHFRDRYGRMPDYLWTGEKTSYVFLSVTIK